MAVRFKQEMLFLIAFSCLFFFYTIASAQHIHEAEPKGDQPLVPVKKQEQPEEILYYTCGMHPSVKVSPESYAEGNTKCPICFMPLTPVSKGIPQVDETFDENVISRVNIKQQELQLAGVQTEPVIRRHLYKEIRTVGTVAYDPQLAIAQDEFISTIKTLNKIREGQVSDITQRAESLVSSSKRKLRLLGLSEAQIDELENTQEIQTNLILPEEKMWVYGDVYEYELGWVKRGSEVKVTTISLPGKEFYGEIASINPVLDPQTRSLRFRALVDTPELKLKPQMYVNITIMSHYTSPDGEHEVLSIKKEAFLDTGRRKIVWIDKGNGQFEGRAVELGPEASSATDKDSKFYPVLRGLNEGDLVVTKANFLIDSQSQITGVAGSAYGGALGVDESEGPPKGIPGHVH